MLPASGEVHALYDTKSNTVSKVCSKGLLIKIVLLFQIKQLSSQIQSLRDEIQSLEDDINSGNDEKSKEEIKPPTAPRDKSAAWVFITELGTFYSHLTRSPIHKGPAHIAVSNLNVDLKKYVDTFSKKIGQMYEYYRLEYGYMRLIPYSGVHVRGNFILKEVLDVQRVEQSYHLDIKQSFGDLEFIEEEEMLMRISKPPFNMQTNYEKTVNFILPLSGRFETFIRFMHTYSELFLKTMENVVLVIVYSVKQMNSWEETKKVQQVLDFYQKQYPESVMKLVEITGAFSRGIALNKGASLFPGDALLFILDVDIHLSRDVLYRIRANTLQNRQVYFPIMFSQFDPQYSCTRTEFIKNNKCLVDNPEERDHFDFREINGYWRQFGFGEVSIFKSDFDQIGGYDTTIVGWGKEDVHFLEATFKHNLLPLNSIDPGIIHIYHPYSCDPNLPRDQYDMCLQSMRSTFVSSEILTEMVYNNEDILHKRETQWWEYVQRIDDSYENLIGHAESNPEPNPNPG